MPRIVEPPLPSRVRDATVAFGSQVRVSIVSHLRFRGPSTRSDIAAAIDVEPKTVHANLSALEDIKLISTNPPAELRRRGETVHYSVDLPRLAELTDALLSAVGER